MASALHLADQHGPHGPALAQARKLRTERAQEVKTVPSPPFAETRSVVLTVRAAVDTWMGHYAHPAGRTVGSAWDP